MSTAIVTWNPTALNAAVYRAFGPSIKKAATDANINSPSSRAGAKAVQSTLTSGGLVATGELGLIMEKGARPHSIVPEVGEVFFLKGLNTFVSGPVRHPGSPAKPYIGPAGKRWALGGFQREAKSTLASSGFRMRLP